MNIIRSANSELFDKASQLTTESLQHGKPLDVAIYATLFYFKNSQKMSTLELASLQSWLLQNFEATSTKHIQQTNDGLLSSDKSTTHQPSKLPTFSKRLRQFNFQSLTLPWAVVIASIILSLAMFFWAKTIENRIKMNSAPRGGVYH